MGLFDTLKDTFSGSAEGDIWNSITEPTQFDDILKKSDRRPQLIYKHSHRCSVCFVSRGNLENASEDILKYADMHFLNVVQNRKSSDYIAEDLDVRHESPQVILVDDRDVIWHASHGSIDGDKILEVLES